MNEELKNLAPRLAALLKKQNPFRVPDNYFEENLKKLQSLTSDTSDPEFADPRLSFRIPEGYFESLDERILSRIKESGANGQDEVPEGYFESLPDKILNRVREEQASPAGETRERRSRIVRINWIKTLAAAAVISGLVLTYGILVRQSNESKVIAGLNSVSTAELETYLTNQLDNLDEEELNTVIDLNESMMLDNEKELLKEDELEDFLLEDMDITTIEDIL